MYDPTKVEATPEGVKEFFQNPLWLVYYARLYEQWKTHTNIVFCDRTNIDHIRGYAAGVQAAMMIKDDMLSDAMDWANQHIEKSEENQNEHDV